METETIKVLKNIIEIERRLIYKLLEINKVDYHNEDTKCKIAYHYDNSTSNITIYVDKSSLRLKFRHNIMNKKYSMLNLDNVPKGIYKAEFIGNTIVGIPDMEVVNDIRQKDDFKNLLNNFNRNSREGRQLINTINNAIYALRVNNVKINRKVLAEFTGYTTRQIDDILRVTQIQFNQVNCRDSDIVGYVMKGKSTTEIKGITGISEEGILSILERYYHKKANEVRQKYGAKIDGLVSIGYTDEQIIEILNRSPVIQKIANVNPRFYGSVIFR